MGGGYSETLGFGLSDNFHLGGYSETLGFGLSDNFHLGGYSETLRFGLSDNFHWGGILKLSDLDSLTIFIGGVFWNSRIWTLWQFSLGEGGILYSDLDSLTIFIWGGILKLSDLDSRRFSFWGVFWNSRIWTLWQFSFWGGILYLDLDSLTIFILVGVFCTQTWTLWQFSFWQGGDSVFQNRGILPEFGPKFQPLQQAHASQIVSHILRMWRLISNKDYKTLLRHEIRLMSKNII